MDNQINVVNALEQIFQEREKFILIGLTGRTGSGCTSSANLLSSDLSDFDLPKPKLSNFDNNDERKERIIYNYTQRHWNKFTVISVRDVITSFLLDHKYSEFESYIMELIEESEHKLHISRQMKDRLEAQYEEYYNERKKIKDLKENTKDEIQIKAKRSYDFYYSGIKDFSVVLKE